MEETIQYVTEDCRFAVWHDGRRYIVRSTSDGQWYWMGQDFWSAVSAADARSAE